MKTLTSLYIIGLTLVEYLGENPTPLMGNSLREKVMLKKGDIFVTTPVTAVSLCGGTRYREIKGVSELTDFIGLSDETAPLSSISDEDLENEMISRGLLGASVPASDTEAEKEAAGETDTPEETVLTKENVMQADIKVIKEACKKHGVTIGKKNKNDLVALLLPYLS